MDHGVCAECGSHPSRFYIIHPERDRPEWVCEDCEQELADRIAVRQADPARDGNAPRPVPVVADEGFAIALDVRPPGDHDLGSQGRGSSQAVARGN